MSKKSQLRIIGGQWRGRKLSIAEVPGLRPTGDRIRETLFNWLMADIDGSRCLDCFAGSGALGFECLSRGAQSLTMLEVNPVAAKQLEAHRRLLKADDEAQIIQTDTVKWLRQASLPKHSFDIIFIDPPFAKQLWQPTIDALVEKQLLAKGARIYIESPKEKLIQTHIQWQLRKEKVSGAVRYQLFDA